MLLISGSYFSVFWDLNFLEWQKKDDTSRQIDYEKDMSSDQKCCKSQ